MELGNQINLETIPKKKILCFGDSLTEGYIDKGNSFHPYSKKLTELLGREASNVQVINAGVSGEPVWKEMYSRLPKIIATHKPIDILVIQGGTNDIRLFAELKSSLDLFTEFNKLLQIARDSNVQHIYALTILEGYFDQEPDAAMDQIDSNNIRKEFNEKLKNFAKGNEDWLSICDVEKLMPLYQLSDDDQRTLWDDHLHPSASGYDKMGEIIYEHIYIDLFDKCK